MNPPTNITTTTISPMTVIDSWVNLHASVIGYRSGLRFCAYLSAAWLVVSCFISRRKEPRIFEAG
jgi:hypothetical protein